MSFGTAKIGVVHDFDKSSSGMKTPGQSRVKREYEVLKWRELGNR